MKYTSMGRRTKKSGRRGVGLDDVLKQNAKAVVLQQKFIMSYASNILPRCNNLHKLPLWWFLLTGTSVTSLLVDESRVLNECI